MDSRQLTAFIYARVSTQEQGKGFSLDTQIEAEQRYCQDRGYTVVGEFIDRHSGTEFDRPGMNELIDALAATHPDVIVLYDVDRLGRELWCKLSSNAT